MRTLADLLASVSDILFPAELGEHPVTMNCHGVCGDTPLHVMVWQDDLDGLRMLIAAGADVNAMGDMGETPLHVALNQSNQPMVNALMYAGARTDMRSEFGHTAVELAKRKGIAGWLLPADDR